eukprot:1192379-Prorocentrum_minimum.AAC.5
MDVHSAALLQAVSWDVKLKVSGHLNNQPSEHVPVAVLRMQVQEEQGTREVQVELDRAAVKDLEAKVKQIQETIAAKASS